MKKTICAVLLMFLMIISSTESFAAKPKRVKFAKNATEKIIKGTMKSYKSGAEYLISVKAGQTLVVKQENRDNHYISLIITAPNGEDVTDSAANCNSNKTISDTIAGDYKISVKECLKADAWRGGYQIKFKVN